MSECSFLSSRTWQPATNNKKGKEKDLLSFLDGKAVKFFYSLFTKGGVVTTEGSDFKKVKEALIGEFEVQEEPQELIRKAIAAILHLANLTSSTDPMFKKAEFKEKTRYGVLHNCAMKVKQPSAFKI